MVLNEFANISRVRLTVKFFFLFFSFFFFFNLTYSRWTSSLQSNTLITSRYIVFSWEHRLKGMVLNEFANISRVGLTVKSSFKK